MLTYDILNKLREETTMSSKDIARELMTSPSKIRKEMLFIERILPQYGAYVEIKRGRGNGYTLMVRDSGVFDVYMSKLEKLSDDDKHLMNHPNSRIEVLCEKLLSSSIPLKSEDLAVELMISGRQLSNDLRVVRDFLNDYSLELRNKPHYGMSVDGTEFNKRLCLANLYMKNFGFNKWRDQQLYFANAENHRMIERIREIIQDESYKYKIQFSDIALQNLVVHLFIIVKRSSTNQSGEVNVLEHVSDSEKEITRNIILRMSQEFSITFNEYDYQYIAIHIAGKRAYLDNEASLIPNEVKELTSDFLLMVDSIYKTTFSQDENLLLRLQLHFAPLLIRIRNGITSKNPLTNEVKSKYAMSYEIAFLINREFEKRYGVKLIDDELAYIAIHFELSLYQTKLKKYKVLLICHTGTCSSEILKQQLLGKFSNFISQLDTCAVNQIVHYDLEEYTFAFSTVPITVLTKTPIYLINDFLDDKSSNFIHEIFERGDLSEEITRKFFPHDLFMGVITVENREEVIQIMSNHIKANRDVPDDFFQQVMSRESVSSTDYGNSVAIPHPMHMNEDGNTYSCVCILKKPIKWKNNMVRVVFLNNISKGGNNIQYYYYLLSKFITNEKYIEALIRNPEYENMVDLMNDKE